MYKPVETIASVCPITLDQLRKHCDVEGFTDDDEQLQDLAQTAFDYLHGTAGILGRALIAGEWTQRFNGFDCIRFGIGPLASVTSIAYTDADGNSQTVPSADYNLFWTMDGRGELVCLSADGWPTVSDKAGSIVVTFEAGTQSLPKPLATAILMHVASMYEGREGGGPGSDGYKRLIAGFKLKGV